MNSSTIQASSLWNESSSYLRLPADFFQEVKPKAASNPELLILNGELANLLDLNFQAYSRSDLASLFSGGALSSEARPIALAYAGHQFGNFTKLGDGRAILIGEKINLRGDKFDIQLKGCGPTAFSRNGDGLATLEAMLKEYLFGEVLHSLNIPSSRSLALVKTNESVRREKHHTRAIVTRVASSHIRVGTFEYAARLGITQLKAIADYAIERHYPNLIGGHHCPYLAFLEEVINRQAQLVAKWMSVGFIHGVLNTDNVLITGQSIDFGPCAFMDYFDSNAVFSSIDTYGRYAYSEQVSITLWNLCRLAECLIPLIELKYPDKAIEKAQGILEKFQDIYETYWSQEFCKKIGFENPNKDTEDLAIRLLTLMQQQELDFTSTFRNLAYPEKLPPSLNDWKNSWQQLHSNLNSEWNNARELILNTNPAVIPRNHYCDQIIKETCHSFSMTKFQDLLAALKKPFNIEAEKHALANPPASNTTPFVTFCGT